MNHLRPLCIVSLFAATLAAQGAPPPASQLAAFKPMVGHWQGEGTAQMQEGAPMTPWTATVLSDWVLGGHFLQSDVTIEFEGMGTMRLREYLGWDGENNRYAQITINNLGEGSLTHPTIDDEGTLRVMSRRVNEGSPYTERVVSRYSGDKSTFSVEFLPNDGPVTLAVEGAFVRTEKVTPSDLYKAEPLMPPMAMPGHEPMTKLGRMAGVFDFEGEMIMAPGMPKTTIAGRDTIRQLFGGSVLQVETKGTAEGMPGEYEARGYYAWNPTDNCYQLMSVSNFGEIGAMQGHFVDNALVCIYAGRSMGNPTALRVILNVDAEGRPASIENHSCIGTAAPMLSFAGKYTPVK